MSAKAFGKKKPVRKHNKTGHMVFAPVFMSVFKGYMPSIAPSVASQKEKSVRGMTKTSVQSDSPAMLQ